MTPIILTNNILPLFTGFYAGWFDIDAFENIESPFTYEDYIFEYDEFREDVSKECCEIIETRLKEFGFDIKVKFLRLYRPTYYNYQTDMIYVEYVFTEETQSKILDILKEEQEYFEEFFNANSREKYADSDDIGKIENDFDVIVKYILFLNDFKVSNLVEEIFDYCHLEQYLKPDIDIQERLNKFLDNLDYSKMSKHCIFVTVFDYFNQEEILFDKIGNLINEYFNKKRQLKLSFDDN